MNEAFWIIRQRQAPKGKGTDLVCSKCGYIRVNDFSWGIEPEEVAHRIGKDSIFPYCESCGSKMSDEDVKVEYNDGRKYYVLIGGNK